jgi:hypothetical protein
MSFTFIPKYTVLKTDLSKEESVYIMVENATDAAFYFFPSKYPNSAHYKMVPTELQIQGCENHNKCEEVMECERAVTITCWGNNSSSYNCDFRLLTYLIQTWMKM